MKIKVRSPGSATIINAIATGKGSAFAIQRHVTAEVELIPEGIKCVCEEDIDTTLMRTCAKLVLEKYNITSTGLKIKTTSNLPVASGLSSSSATSNAIVMAASKLIAEEFSLEPLKRWEILNLAIDASLKAGVTITGAFDDASASFYGGFTITDNLERKIIKRGLMENQKILIYMPKRKSLTAESNVKRMKILAPLVEIAFKKALEGDLYRALTLNGIIYCATLGFNPEVAVDALEAGAIAAGLSGTGPAFVSITREEKQDDIIDAWSSYPGDIIITSVDNQGTQFR
ncbi:MAG: shikimate kinase [Methanothermobacter sp.]|nr:shikimate kinase [Methanothermobacter sp.]